MIGTNDYLADLNRGRSAIAGRNNQGMMGGSRFGRGSEATGFIPAPPDLGQSSANAVGINMANMGALQQLYDQVANKYVPGYGGLAESSSRNIDELLNPTNFYDTQRRGAEMGSARGITGSPLEFAGISRMTDEEKIRRQMLGEQALSGAATRGKGILPFENFFVTPGQSYENDWLTKQLQAAPNPAEAYNLNMANAALGVRSGQRAGYGGGGGGAFGGYGGNMISGTPSRVDSVVSKYSRSLAPTQSSNGWGVSNGMVAGNVPQDEMQIAGIPQDSWYWNPEASSSLDENYDWVT